MTGQRTTVPPFGIREATSAVPRGRSRYPSLTGWASSTLARPASRRKGSMSDAVSSKTGGIRTARICNDGDAASSTRTASAWQFPHTSSTGRSSERPSASAVSARSAGSSP